MKHTKTLLGIKSATHTNFSLLGDFSEGGSDSLWGLVTPDFL